MNKFYLSQDEIAVLAGLMGGDIVYGVKSDLFTHYKEHHKQRVKSIMEKMMSRQLFSIDFDNHVSMNSDLYDAMKTIVNASSILSVNEIYYFKKDHDIYMMSLGKHLYCIQKCCEKLHLSGDALDIDEFLSDEDYDVIEDALSSFDEDYAYNYLNRKGKNASLIMNIINDNYKKTVVEYYEWKDNMICIQDKIAVGNYEDKYFEIYKDNQLTYYKGGLDYTYKYINKMFGR